MRYGGCQRDDSRAPRIDRQDRPCPDCGASSFAYHTNRYPRLGDIQRRICLQGHRWIWRRLRARPIRRSEVPAPRTLVCIFPDCGRETGRARAKRTGTRAGHCSLCDGHAKQKERHGWKNLRPLLLPHGKRRSA